VDNEDDEITVHTEGYAKNNGGSNARAGAGLFFQTDDPRNMSIRIPKTLGPLATYSSSRASIDAVTKFLRRNEDEGFLNRENGRLLGKKPEGQCKHKRS